MFRRREEGLFDNNDAAQTPESAESGAATSASSASQSANPPAAPSQSRFTSPSSSQPQSGFRSGAGSSNASSSTTAAPLPAELTRNRMPEAKSSAAPAAPAASAPSAPSGSLPASLTNFTTGTSEKPTKTLRRVLTVGSDILLKGEIATCDRLVIEGKVDATLNDVHTVEITESGSFKGSAYIEEAEISGLFEGDLVVRGRLVIFATGKVRGKITYGAIEIERGGELTGEIKLFAEAQPASNAPRSPSARQTKEDKVAA